MPRARHIHFDATGTAVIVPLLPRTARVPKTEPYFVSVLPPLELKATRREHGLGNQSTEVGHREASSINTTWTSANYHRLFCAHDKPRWSVCTASTCRRDKHEAARNWLALLRGELR